MKQFTKNRKGQQFFILDLYSIFFFVIALIILLIVISSSYKNKDDKIENAIVGINFPHYVMNEINSHQIEIEYCIDDEDVKTTQKMSIKKALILYDWLANQENLESSCLTDYKNNLKTKLGEIFNEEFAKQTSSSFIIKFQVKNNPDSLISVNTAYLAKTKHHYFNFEIPSQNSEILIFIEFARAVTK